MSKSGYILTTDVDLIVDIDYYKNIEKNCFNNLFDN